MNSEANTTSIIIQQMDNEVGIVYHRMGDEVEKMINELYI